jgi:hypothetical protein
MFVKILFHAAASIYKVKLKFAAVFPSENFMKIAQVVDDP